MWITLEAADDLPAAFAPGHVLALGLRQPDGTLMRHAYTVSRGEPSTRRFEHLYRIVSGGRMSPRLAGLATSAEVFFQGPFHTPIQEEIHPEAERIVLLSTGAGIGPQFGFAEKTLSEGETRPITLFAGFREESHTCLSQELDTLAGRYPNFRWCYTLSSPEDTWQGLRGRVTESVPKLIERDLDGCHFHLVGNGEMVHLVRRTLHRAGLRKDRVSVETYFNHHADPEEEEVVRLARSWEQTRL